MITFVTSTRLLNTSLEAVYPILSTGNEQRTSNPDHKFITRFLPKTEEQVKSLFKFRKNRRQSARIRTKKASSCNRGLKVKVAS